MVATKGMGCKAVTELNRKRCSKKRNGREGDLIEVEEQQGAVAAKPTQKGPPSPSPSPSPSLSLSLSLSPSRKHAVR
jgi:hypothetical protein